ncbi:MAG: BspA family leucine-rich repeat surface protein [Firmicutes bacterium]|nr:BspA family leucine-rich repeat surface protein [Bacillota bacterium]
MKKIGILFLMTIMILCPIVNVNAKDIFSADVTSVEYYGNNNTTGSFSLDGNTIKLLFQKNKDEVVFDINIKNNGNISGKLASVQFEDQNNLVTYSYTGLKKGDTLKSGETKTLRVTAKLKKGLSTDVINTKLKIDFIYGDNIITTTINNPNTYDNIIKFIILFGVSLFALIILTKTRKTKTIKAVLIIISVMTTFVCYNTYAINVPSREVDINIVGNIDKNFMMVADPTNGDTQPVFGNTNILKNQIEKIYTKKELEIPENAISSWDISQDNDESVMAYVLDEDNNGLYELYLCEYGGVIANPDLNKAFAYYTKVIYFDLSNFIVDDVTNMQGMFGLDSKIETLDLSSFDTGNVENMQQMFRECTSLKNINLSGFNTEKVTDMLGMFYKDGKIETLDLSSFNTKKVENMRLMFNSCSKLKELNISSFDMTNVTNTNGMFQSCSSLEDFEAPKNIKNIDNFMYNHIPEYKKESFTIPKTVNFVGYSHMFYDFGGSNFKKFIVEEGNSAYKTVDDILYTADGTRLIAVPRGKTFTDNKFVIPEGVTFLNELSFSRTQNIETLVLPNSYEIQRMMYKNNEYGFLNSGSSLNIAIYSYTSISKFEVKDDNPRYSSYDGCIYSKDGKELISIPLKYNGVLSIKPGTEIFGEQAFWTLNAIADRAENLTEVNIPASVTNIHSDQVILLNLLAAGGKTINIDPENPAYKVENGKVVKIQ